MEKIVGKYRFTTGWIVATIGRLDQYQMARPRMAKNAKAGPFRL